MCQHAADPETSRRVPNWKIPWYPGYCLSVPWLRVFGKRESLLLLVIVAVDVCLFVCFTYMVYTHSSQLERKDLAPLLNTGPEKSTKIPLLLSFKGLKLTVSSVKILACEQSLCLRKGWKNREEPLLAIFFTLSPNKEPVHRLWKSTLCVPRCKEENECFTVQPIKRLCNCIWWANTNGENKEIKKRQTYFWTWRSFHHAQRLG